MGKIWGFYFSMHKSRAFFRRTKTLANQKMQKQTNVARQTRKSPEGKASLKQCAAATTDKFYPRKRLA